MTTPHDPLSSLSDPAPEPKPASNAAKMFVSLYLAVLAFFILLNVLSDMDGKRAETVVKSVRNAFTNADRERDVTGQPVSHPTGPETVFATYSERLTQLIAVDSVDLYKHGTSMHALIPVNAFFTEGGTGIRTEKAPMLDRLYAMLSKDLGKYRFHIECVIGSAEYLEETEESALALARAGSLARALTERGLPSAQVAVGLTQKHPGYMLLSFALRQTEAKVTLDSGKSPEEEGKETP